MTHDVVVATASSGNHGRAVAAGARLFGCRCVIFLPKFTSADKEAAIRARGAEVVRVAGDYDFAVEECRRQAQTNGWRIISDTHMVLFGKDARYGLMSRRAATLALKD